MVLFKMVNGVEMPLSEEELTEYKLNEEAHQARLELLDSWTKKRENEYRGKIDPFLLTALSEHYLDADSSKLDTLKRIKLEIKEKYPKT